jgi:hypothetical protein
MDGRDFAVCSLTVAIAERLLQWTNSEPTTYSKQHTADNMHEAGRLRDKCTHGLAYGLTNRVANCLRLRVKREFCRFDY